MLDPMKVRKYTAPAAANILLLFVSASLSGCALLGEQKKAPEPHLTEATQPVATAPPEPPEIIPLKPSKSEEPLLANHFASPNRTGRSYRVNGTTYHPLLTTYGY